MSSRIRFHPAARDELREAALWYERARPGLGSEFHAEVDEILDRLLDRSLEGVQVQTPAGRVLSRVFLHRFPYAIYFGRLDDELVIWAVAHGKRRPRYWKERL